jgi:ATP-dependent helicase/nuclease subunit A
LERIDLSFFGAPAAHVEASRILEREGLAPDHPAHAAVVARVRGFLGSEYATRAARDSARVSREHAFVMDVDGGEGRAVWLRGTIDLLVLWPDGSVDVLDYKRARGPSVAPYAFQLGVYALAAQRVAGAGAAVRAGVVFLGGPRAEPAWLPAVDGDRLRAEISTLGARLVEARWSGSFPRATIDVCRSIGCGYVRHCHP